MKRLEIFVPDYNDSFSKVALDGKEYQIRFTWNDTAERWTFGVYSIFREPIVQGVKMVPCFQIDFQYVDERLPTGIFGVFTKLAAVGRKDFLNGNKYMKLLARRAKTYHRKKRL